MNEQAFLRNLAEFLRDRAGHPPEELTLDTDLVESRVLDSFLVIELFFHMEGVLGRSLDVDGFAIESVGTPRRIYERYVKNSCEAGE
jgi:hypothetical protein